ncbi:TetR/AcrR family transcriptional regulator [Demequina capsici]|uniref:TetR/AcrR family transcriptional regulator n=1 Tax=Demequina capsici TaxID=3075620 RepID=A0AA96FAV2_9MICO|nr:MULTISPECIES: TetR/AcrR family transcriptional regulator [unclassified Demequina]WNM25256.1 TetR/AcrR family transcriptional regulator [Demequina sp. OYTSA14]WNM28153.1 TetR/AcrR family transcriptional regulator [Demequina sp. PMTSA13]
MTAPGGVSTDPRERLASTASDLFYREGIHSVGVDRILAEAGMSRATMYRHFGGKEDLVVAYLQREDALIRAQVASADADGGLLRAAVHGIADDVERRHTRGCPFINAAAEYPDEASAVRRLIATHRAWFRGALTQAAAAAGVADPERVAGALMMLRDAALVGGYLDGAASIRSAFLDAASAVSGVDLT